MNLYTLEKELSIIYQFDKYDDYCYNGIQVEGRCEINKIILAVNLSMDLIDYAVINKADAIIVHHGFFGKSFLKLKGNLKDRVKKLLDNNISLLGIHLPMDANIDIGHNRIIADIIKLNELKLFNYGFIGTNKLRIKINDIKKMIETYFYQEINIKIDSIQIYDYLNKIPEKIGIISGESYKYFEDAILEGVDLFICGSIAQHIPEIAKESKKAIMALGHYNSEIAGIVALSKILYDKFNIENEIFLIENNL
ncbi:MAG: Nif3-like dinuclear metal center hexameric protein [Exilispira sp.]